ncbi:oxidoreductase [Actinomadura craniellae]|uniref:Oxidoreductase n=1 Tax=Actinomadura craniellae TaxID=2231787 RepID=A0A365GYK2_9ACTN|nr:Gfo/Idh/MocA family oxidoreductase [Actinomadura craniellae]RAY11848.1 oxidoreductase [Actinomadura craniellae]
MSLRVALIGYGVGGAVFHAPLIDADPDLTLAAVVTSSPERQEAVRERYLNTRVVDRPETLWESAAAYDLVVVSTPNRLHVPLARAALEHGLPAVVDKPVATTAAEARGLAELAAARALPVIPFHNRRWDGDFRTVQALLAEGSLGTPLRLESRFERWRPEVREGWKESSDPADAGGILYDLGSHLIDQALVLFGPPTGVYAEIETRRPGALAPDDVFVALGYEHGVRVHLWMSAVAAQFGPRFRVLGDHSAYMVYGMDPQEDALRAGGTPLDEGWGEGGPQSYGLLGTPGSTRAVTTLPGAYQEFYAAVARTIGRGEPPPVALEDAITGLQVIETALQAARLTAPAG